MFPGGASVRHNCDWYLVFLLGDRLSRKGTYRTEVSEDLHSTKWTESKEIGISITVDVRVLEFSLPVSY